MVGEDRYEEVENVIRKNSFLDLYNALKIFNYYGFRVYRTKRVFGFDETKTEKYVAKSVHSGQMSFSKTCAKVSRLCGIHRKVVDLVVSGLVDMMAEDIDDGKSVQLGEFGIFRPTIKAKSADTAEGVTASNIVRKHIVFTPGIHLCPCLYAGKPFTCIHLSTVFSGIPYISRNPFKSTCLTSAIFLTHFFLL